jgi:hypothetical protein
MDAFTPFSIAALSLGVYVGHASVKSVLLAPLSSASDAEESEFLELLVDSDKGPSPPGTWCVIA